MGGNRQKKNRMEVDETAASPSFDAYGLPSYSNALAMAAAAAAAAAADEPMPGAMPEMAPVSSYSDSSSDDSSDDDCEAEKYGYGEAQPDSESKPQGSWSVAERPQEPSWRRRRATFSFHPQNSSVEDRRSVPFHPHRRPSRSSLKGSSPAAAERRRRASVQGPCDLRVTIAILEQLDPKSVLEVRLPGRRDSIKRRRSITFNEGVAVRRIQRTSSLVANPKDLWFQNDEYSAIKRKTRALLRNVDHGTGMTADGQKYCVRGLERLMGPSKEREVTKLVALDSVLVEQRMQRSENVFCDESLSNMYRKTTTRSTLEAARLARADAMEAASFYDLDCKDGEDGGDDDCVMVAAAAAAAANFSDRAGSARRPPYARQRASMA